MYVYSISIFENRSFWFVSITNNSSSQGEHLTEQLYDGDKFTDVMFFKRLFHVFDC